MPWNVDDSTGLLAHFIGTVQSSIWTTDATRSDPNKPFLAWQVSVDDVMQDNFQGTIPETISLNISIGNGWTEDEDGLTVEHKDGVEMFKASSAYGKIIGIVAGKSDSFGSNVVVKDGGGDLEIDLAGLAKYMGEQGFDDPRVSNIWNGLTFEFRGFGFRYRDTKSDDEVFQNVLPVRFVGVGEAAAEAKPAKATKAEKAASEVRDTVGIWTSNGADDDTAKTLNDLANSVESHTAFVKQALVIPAVQESDDLKAAVMDASVFN